MNTALLEWLAECKADPVGFVMGAFPWGEAGSRLEDWSGPEPWQRQILEDIAAGLPVGRAIQLAVASGHGVGKSALVAWIILWAFSTLPDTLGTVTANTETQLKTKTWAQLGKWFNMFIAREHFQLTATALLSRDPERDRTWRIDMVPWSERNPEAFAGMHNQGRRIIMVFDEASNIDDVIWETTEGALTDLDTEIIWCVFGNPTRNTGRFKECFPGGKYSRDWKTRQIDSREISFTDKEQIARWIEREGEDSDFVRVRVRGVFPRAGTRQFISSEAVFEAMKRDPLSHRHDPLVLGVDVARFGDDASVIYIRKGRDGRTHPPRLYRSVDTMTLAGHVASAYSEFHADAVFVDGGGVGGGVVDRLRQLHVPVWDIDFGTKSDSLQGLTDGMTFANKRAEMWGNMKEWLKTGSIPDDREMAGQLISVEYGYNVRNEIQLERKDDMRRRGAISPDIADALALTFAYPVMAHALAGREGADKVPLILTDYDPFKEAA